MLRSVQKLKHHCSDTLKLYTVAHGAKVGWSPTAVDVFAYISLTDNKSHHQS